MADLPSEIAEFVKNVIGHQCKRDELVREIIKMASHNPAWPKATSGQWAKAIDEAHRRGLLIVTSQTVWIPVPKVEPVVKQKTLFD